MLFSRTGRKLRQKQCSERIVKAKAGNLRSRVICVNTFRHFFNLLVSHFPFSLMLSMLACRLRKDRSYSLFDFPLICRRFPHAIPAEPKINPTRIEKTKKTPLWLEKNGRIYIFTYHNSHFFVFTFSHLDNCRRMRAKSHFYLAHSQLHRCRLLTLFLLDYLVISGIKRRVLYLQNAPLDLIAIANDATQAQAG